MAAPKRIAQNTRRNQSIVEDEPSSLRIGRYTRLNEIGRGSFATVYRGIHNELNTFVAVKTVSLTRLSTKLRENLRLEIEILKSVQHPHIVALLDCYESGSTIHLVMEFCALGDLSRFIRKRNSMAKHEVLRDMMTKYPNPPGDGLNEVIVRHFLTQLSSALKFIRDRELIHRDVKPQNLLLHPSPSICAKGLMKSVSYQGSEGSFTPIVGVSSLPMLKVADFGFARTLPATSLADTLCGSPLYMAPEILRYQKYDAKADLWSVGAVLFEMVVGKPPYKAANHIDLLHAILARADRIPFPRDLVIAPDLKKLIRGLLKVNPVERISYSALFNDPVVTDGIPGLVGEDLQEQLQRQAVREGKLMESKISDQSRSGNLQENPAHSTKMQPIEIIPTPGHKDSIQTQIQPQTGPNQASQHNRSAISSTPRRTTYDNSNTQRTTQISQDSPISKEPPPIQDKQTIPPEKTDSRRGQSKPSSAPSPVMQQQQKPSHVESERIRAAQDIAFERDYVVVERRSVEVNAFADELAASPQLKAAQAPSRQSGAIVRRATTASSQSPRSSTNGSVKEAQTGSSKPVTGSPHRRRSSYDRRYGPNPASATSAISRALNLASGRLFGLSFSPPLALTKGGRSPPVGYNPFPAYPLGQSSVVLVGNETKPQPLDEDSKIVHKIEECATRSDVVYGFAEVKYKQLIPFTPSTGSDTTIKPLPRTDPNSAEPTNSDLTVDAVLILSEEALVLYVKALALLAKSMDIAGAWWARKNRGEIIGDNSTSRIEPNITAGSRVNNVVQWVRNRFNEVLQKAEYSRRRLLEAQKQLPPDHPYRHNPHVANSETLAAFDRSTDQIVISSGITAEKLMYDRALEMSRTAAINELTGEDLQGCEIAYITAIRMLEAVLENDEMPHAGNDRGSGGEKTKEVDLARSGVHIEDSEVVAKLVESIRARLRALRKKMSMMAKRTSAPPGTSPKSPALYARPASPVIAHASGR
ncbi:Serine/threonine-protein kinase [Myotisia sp. PD_48]|nr:Serine/threonine-protein kinase [Myotisia sp. PD_48]